MALCIVVLQVVVLREEIHQLLAWTVVGYLIRLDVLVVEHGPEQDLDLSLETYLPDSLSLQAFMDVEVKDARRVDFLAATQVVVMEEGLLAHFEDPLDLLPREFDVHPLVSVFELHEGCDYMRQSLGLRARRSHSINYFPYLRVFG